MKVLLKRLEAGLRPLSPLTVTGIALCWVLALGLADYYTPRNVTLIGFYFLAVVFAGWRAGKWEACVVSGVAAATTFTVYWVLQRGVPHSFWVAAWNNATRFVIFSLTGWLAAEMASLTRNLEKQVAERTEQWKLEAENHKITASRLTETIERFEQVINNITEVFWLRDVAKRQVVYISPGYEHIWGRKCQELHREPDSWLAAVHPADRDTVARRSTCEQAAGGYDIEYRIVRPDGELRWIRDRAFPVRNARGEVYRIAGVAEDVTERRQIRETLRMQAAMLENMAEAVVVTDQRGLIVQMNPAAERIWGYRRDEVLGKPATVFSALPEAEALAIMRGVLEALEAEGTWRGTFNNKRKDGAIIRCEALISRVEIQGNVFLVAVEQDVTERRHAERALARSEELYRTLFELSPDGILLEDTNGDILDANKAICHSFGYSRETLLGRNVRCLVPPADLGQVEPHLAALKSGQSLQHEVWDVRANGERCLMWLNEKPLALPDGHQGILVVARDITDTKRAELTKEAFLSLGTKLGAARTPVEAARAIYASADVLWKWDCGALDLSLEESGQIETVLAWDVVEGQRREVEPGSPVGAPTPRIRRIMAQGGELILRQPGELHEADFVPFGDVCRLSASLMYVPLRKENQAIGVLSVQSYTRDAFTRADLQTLQALADHCGGALERLRAEAARRQSEELNRAILATAMDGFLALDFGADPQGAITEVNDAYCRMTGYSREELLRMRITDLEAQESPEEVDQHKERILSGPGDRFETRHRRKDGQEIYVEISACRLAGSGQRIFDFVRDITERKKAEQSLAEALEFNRQVVSASSIGICVYKTSGQCVMVNNALARITGGTVEQLLQQDFRRLKSWEADGLLAKAEAALETRQPEELECTSRTTFGRQLSVSARFSSFVAQGELHLLLMITDQTAARLTRDALRVSEERYRTLAESSPDAIFILDRDIRVEYVNSPAAALWRRGPAELIGLKQPELFPPETAQYYEEVVRKVFATGQSVRRDEPLTFPTGDQWIEIRLAPLYDARGSVASVMGVCRDITERKRAERQLTEALDLNQKMLAAATVGIGAYKASGECIFANEALARIVGGSLDDLLQGNFRDAEAWRQSGLFEMAEEALREGQASSRELFCATRFGKRVWLDCHMASFVSNGKPHLLLMALDISERKQAEQALKMHSLVLQSMSEGVLLVGPDQTILFANPALDSMFGYERGELIGQNVAVLNAWSPEETARFNEDMTHASSEPATWSREYQNRRKDGSCFASEARVSLVELGGRNHWVGVQQDITERKRAEEIQRQAERLQKALLDNIPDPAWLKDAEGRFLACNQALARFFGRPVEAIIGKTVFDCVAHDAERLTQEDSAVIHTRRASVAEAPVKNAEGTIRWLESIKSPLCNARDEVIGTVGIARDVTERKQTESLLQAQRDLGVSLSTTSEVSAALKRFLDFALQMGGFDCGGVYLVNQATQGLDLAEHRGTSASFARAVAHFSADSPQMRIVRQGTPLFTVYQELDISLDEVQRREALQAFALLPLNHEHEIIGALVVASHTAKQILPQTRLVMEALATQGAGALARIHAEAERHRLERQILEITDREQARIGQDIHDGLCQHLVSLAFDAHFLVRELSSRRHAQAPMARRMAELADQTITETRQLARGLFPVRLESEGLPSALEELARTTRERFQIHCCFRSKGAVAVPSGTVATHLYRIAQEAVANAVKHSQAKAISIDLRALDEQLRLEIKDNGKGLRPGTRRAEGMGLHIMDYRARSIGGALRVSNRLGGGTQVFCCVPRQL